MWKNIVLNDSFIGFYNFRFMNKHSTVNLHLMKWQYWWWFFFSFFFILYYILFNRIVSSRGEYSCPKNSTSLRPHGRWGDLVVGVIPVYWCLNILINSNIILKLSEWQSECSLVTVRVRGKQWYWVYKTNTDYSFFYEKSKISFGKKKCFLVERSNVNKDSLFFSFFWENKFNTEKALSGFTKVNKNILFYGKDKSKKSGVFNQKKNLTNNIMGKKTYENVYSFPLFRYNGGKKIFYCDNGFFSAKNKNYFDFFLKKTKISLSEKSNKSFLYKNVKKNNICLYKNPSFSSSKKNPVILENAVNIGIKGYRRFYPTLKQQKLENFFFLKKNKYSFLLKNNFLKKQQKDYFLKNNSRLLNVNTPLVLPTQKNIGIISNSFDVVHSWFLPGLGVKIDCVPGRSTHSTIYINNPGVYYGQCAEVCGRFHHHMPIRVVALPFEHFVVWWFNFLRKTNKNSLLWHKN